MKTSNHTSDRPPWPDDTEEALTLQGQHLREMAKGRRPSEGTLKRIGSWMVRVAILALVFWLLCETVGS